MRPIPPSNAELRFKYEPAKTWAALIVIGAILNVVRNAVYGVPVMPVRQGLTTFFVLTTVGACYFVAIEAWLLLRRFFVR